MPADQRSLLDTRALTTENITKLFRMADKFRERSEAHGFFYDAARGPVKQGSKVVALLFFEASTRTRLSFQAAAYRLGLPVLTMEFASSSLSKGESLSDTIQNVLAMGPDALVLRYGSSAELDQLIPRLDIPVINAGFGTLAHPTQALLDAYTIYRERGQVVGERVLIVGDILHSRVARSNFDVLQKLGAEIGVCGPARFLPPGSEISGIRVFDSVDDGLRWATVCMGLRIQFERHQQEASDDDHVARQVAEYHRSYGITRARLQSLIPEGILMHPGPINHGVEFSSDALEDPRCRVLQQVTNGVLIRAALLAKTVGMSELV